MTKDLSSYFDLRELVKDCGGIEKFRFFGHLNKPVGPFLCEYSDDWVECKLEDDRSYGDLYTLDRGYKVKIVPAKVKVVPAKDMRYTGRYFYQCDLLSMIKDGHFILKTGDGDHIVKREGIELLCGNVYLYHRWQEIVKE